MVIDSASSHALNSVFGRACWGLQKKLAVVAECVDADLIGGSSSENKAYVLQCPPNEYIGSIPFASFGTPTGSFPNFAADPSCDAPGAVAAIEAECVGDNECTIAVNQAYVRHIILFSTGDSATSDYGVET